MTGHVGRCSSLVEHHPPLCMPGRQVCWLADGRAGQGVRAAGEDRQACKAANQEAQARSATEHQPQRRCPLKLAAFTPLSAGLHTPAGDPRGFHHTSACDEH